MSDSRAFGSNGGLVVYVCKTHGSISRAACHAHLIGPLCCSYCPPGSAPVKQLDTLRALIEEYLQQAGYENAASDRQGVTGWMAPEAGYEDGIEWMTTLEAVAQQIQREAEHARS